MATLNPGAIVVLCLLFIILLNPPTRVSYDQEELVATAIAQEQYNLELLNNSTYGAFAPWHPTTGDGQEDNGTHIDKTKKWLNLTGLREGDGYKWDLLPNVRERALELVEEATQEKGSAALHGRVNQNLLVYHNISGWLRGKWIRSGIGENVSTPALNLSKLAPEVGYKSFKYGRNITGSQGKVHMKLDESQQDLVREGLPAATWVTARVTLQDETSYADGWTTTLYGVHYPESGSVLLTTTSEKFAGIFALPHLGLTQRFFDLSQTVLNETLLQHIAEQKDDLMDAEVNPWTSVPMEEDAGYNPLCELIIYLQLFSLKTSMINGDEVSLPKSLLKLEDMERELRFPSGVSFSDTPGLHMNMVVYSPDCGFILESKGSPHGEGLVPDHLHGPKMEVHIADSKRMVLWLAIIVTGQLLLLVQQMKSSSTPSTRSRISFHTLAMMSLGTGFAAFTFLFISSFLTSMYLTAMMVAFLLFLEGNFFGIKFLMDVWIAQEPERTERQRRQQDAVAAAASAAHINSRAQHRPANPPDVVPVALPLPVTTPQEATTLATTLGTPFAQAIPPPAPTITTTSLPLRPPTFGSFYTRYCLFLLGLIFLSIHAATSWPTPLRSFYFDALIFLYLSFWTPQIHRNIIRNCRKPFAFRFVLGQSILRLLPIAYFWCVEGNVLFADPDRGVFGGYVVWMSMQIFVLAGQEVLGPRWCVSEKWSWVPAAWEYHPVLREDEEGATMPIGAAPSSPLDDEELQNEDAAPGDPLLSHESRRRRSSAISVSGAEGVEAASATSAERERQRRGGGRHGRNTGSVRIFDCAICMQTIEAPVVSSSGRSTTDPSFEPEPHPQSQSNNSHPHNHTRRSSTDHISSSPAESRTTNLLNSIRNRSLRAYLTTRTKDLLANLLGSRLLLERKRREYMVTPCRHIFHTQCLEGWMAYRLQCPICREGLPAL